jgi:transposase
MNNRAPKKKPGRPKPVERIELDMSELLKIVDRAGLPKEDLEKLRAALETLQFMTQELEKKRVSIARLRKMLFGASTESTRNVAGQVQQDMNEAGAGNESPKGDSKAEAGDGGQEVADEKKKKKGHGRNGADAYVGAQKIRLSHESLQPGDPCPACGRGKVYETNAPEKIVRITGRPPLDATVYELQKLRCNLCGELFTARAPADALKEKYDAKSASMIALLKYGSGMPFNRLKGLQGNLGIPLPASTQWEVVLAFAEKLLAVWEELVRQGAQGRVLYQDDTVAKILEFLKKLKEGAFKDPKGRRAAQRKAEVSADAEKKAGAKLKAAALTDEIEDEKAMGPERSGTFTTGIVSDCATYQVALFFTGRRHAGENLGKVLQKRAAELPVPIQMCDPLSRNMPKELKTLLANCLTHGRRKFVDVIAKFPIACLYVLRILKGVYANDAFTREQKMSDEARLRYHQTHSGPLMKELKVWLDEQIDGQKVEPNSTLGEAIIYMRKHWHKMTLFLRVPGAPLDNNLVERALKRAILHRKNSYFYKTATGARVGDIFMSLIHTCELNGINPFDYLSTLHEHAADASASPADWMPWNYRQTLDRSDLNAGN